MKYFAYICGELVNLDSLSHKAIEILLTFRERDSFTSHGYELTAKIAYPVRERKRGVNGRATGEGSFN